MVPEMTGYWPGDLSQSLYIYRSSGQSRRREESEFFDAGEIKLRKTSTKTSIDKVGRCIRFKNRQEWSGIMKCGDKCNHNLVQAPFNASFFD